MIPFVFDEDEPDPMQDVTMADHKGENERVQREDEEKKRRSKSPEFAGGITLTMKDGRPISRGEVIQRLKRGESPTWTIRHNGVNTVTLTNPTTTNNKAMTNSSPSVLLPSPEIRHGNNKQAVDGPMDIVTEVDEEILTSAGLEIERPRSALHSGDFRQERDSNNEYRHNHGLNHHHDVATPLSTSPPAPWASRIPSYGSRALFDGPRSVSRIEASSPLRSSLRILPATSPLFHALNTNDSDYPHAPSLSSSPLALSPGALSGARPIPYQAHQPRRSISIPHTPPHSIPRRPRGLSISSYNSPDGGFSSSPIHNRAPMVGSYEESILRGRMSATPSRPLNFIAQIGVLGRGKCRPSLRCPRHVIVQFPAVFYSYPSISTNSSRNSAPQSASSLIQDQPSPYVGLIDVENTFPTYGKPIKDDMGDGIGAPAGGCYRIPQKGQLQIVIKNPNKTAVKLFLVPYDLGDMQPGQKTFIRQRSFSTGGDDLPTANSKDDKNLGAAETRPTLRYLIHLHICCPSKGRYFLYRSVRVVFANRVPDGKEKLRNEVQFPEPKYSAWNPAREHHQHQQFNHFGHQLPMQLQQKETTMDNGQETSSGQVGMAMKSAAAKMEISMRRKSTPVAFKFKQGDFEEAPRTSAFGADAVNVTVSSLNYGDDESGGAGNGLGLSYNKAKQDNDGDVSMSHESLSSKRMLL